MGSKKMFAIEQRDSSNFYPHINEEQDNIICEIQSFFHEYIVDKLVDEVPNDDIDFRFVETESGIQPNGLRHYSLPQDIVDMACGTDPEKLVDFLEFSISWSM